MTTTSPGIRCVFCGRVTLRPAAFIGAMAVGPTCARKHNMMPLAKRAPGSHSVRFVKGHGAQHSTAKRDARTLDLFEGVEA